MRTSVASAARSLRRALALLCLGAAPIVAAEELPYVIKTTSTLAYLDVGTAAGVLPGDWYVVMRPRQGRQLYVQVGELRVLRVFEKFSIAEILAVESGERIEALQRAIAAEAFLAMGKPPSSSKADVTYTLMPEMGPPAVRPAAAPPGRRRTVYMTTGFDWGKSAHLMWIGDQLVDVGEATDRSLGMRLSFERGARWRFNLGYRLSGRPLGAADIDVTQLGLELDLHYLLGQGQRAVPYIGAGVGWNQLHWEGRGSGDDRADKLGISLVGGLQLPLGGAWSLLIEGGFQQVFKWQSQIGGGALRTYAGLGRGF